MAGHLRSFDRAFLHRGLPELLWNIPRVLCNESVGRKLSVDHCVARGIIVFLPVLNICCFRFNARYIGP
jgi:hypothetical protein